VRISEEKIDEIRAAADITDVVGGVVRLRKAGRYFVGLCPFHQEKSPSFQVNPERGIYKCFGCGRGGDVFTFLMEVERLSFVEAVLSLAERCNITVSHETGPARARSRERVAALYEAARTAARFFYDNCRSDAGAAGAEYLRRRGWTQETRTRFGLGFAPDSWDALTRHASGLGIPEDILVESGLAVKRDTGRIYDRFRNRVIFPIFSSSKRVIGFGARALGADEEPKYLNSPDTPIYSKGRALYGLSHASRAIRGEDAVILVEGYADVLTLSQAGIENVVATSGTALTPEQARTLVRHTRNLFFLYDADSAGASAMERGIDILLEQDCDPRIVTLRAGEDPDSTVRKYGPEAIRERLGEAASFVDFIINRHTAKGGMDTPEGKTEAVRKIVDLLSRMDDRIRRDFYVHYLADKYRIYESVLYDALEQRIRRRKTQGSAARTPAIQLDADSNPEPQAAVPKAEKEFFSQLFRAPGQVQKEALHAVHAEAFDDPRTRYLLQLVMAQEEHEGVISVADIQTSLGDDLSMQGLIADVLSDAEASPGWAGRQTVTPPDFRRGLAEACRTLLAKRIERRIGRLDLLQRSAPDDADIAGRIYRLRRMRERLRSLEDFDSLGVCLAGLFEEWDRIPDDG